MAVDGCRWHVEDNVKALSRTLSGGVKDIGVNMSSVVEHCRGHVNRQLSIVEPGLSKRKMEL